MIDALIIGAGPAGSVAALLLARAGWDVALVEQHAFPRDKVCGECLSSLGIDVLSRAGVGDFPAEPVSLSRTLIHSMRGTSCEVALPRPMWGLSRHVLDHHLVNAAQAAGARVLQPARCEAVSPRVIIRNLTSNELESLEATHILRADGKSPSDRSSRDFGIKTHFTFVDGPTDAIELFAVDGSYGGLAPIEGDRWNAAFSVPAASLRSHRGNVAGLFDKMVGENRVLAKRLRGSRQVGAWLASPLPRCGVRDDWAAGITPIGNAAASIEPIGGEGMGLALRSAELATAALIHARQYGTPVDRHRLLADYRRLWSFRSAACRAVAMGVSSQSIAEWVVPAIDGSDAIAQVAMATMGKANGSTSNR